MILRNVAQIHPSPLNVAVEAARDLMRERLEAPDNGDWNEGRVIELRFTQYPWIAGAPFVSLFTNASKTVAALVAQHNLPVMEQIAGHQVGCKVVDQENTVICKLASSPRR